MLSYSLHSEKIKSGISTAASIHGDENPVQRYAPAPGTTGAAFVIPLKQHIGAEGELCVSVGIKYCAASRLPVVAAKCCRFTAHLGYRYGYCAPLYGSSFSLAELSVIIDADGEDCWIPRDAGPIIALAVAKS